MIMTISVSTVLIRIQSKLFEASNTCNKKRSSACSLLQGIMAFKYLDSIFKFKATKVQNVYIVYILKENQKTFFLQIFRCLYKIFYNVYGSNI